jgi:hypothetical protein
MHARVLACAALAIALVPAWGTQAFADKGGQPNEHAVANGNSAQSDPAPAGEPAPQVGAPAPAASAPVAVQQASNPTPAAQGGAAPQVQAGTAPAAQGSNPAQGSKTVHGSVKDKTKDQPRPHLVVPSGSKPGAGSSPIQAGKSHPHHGLNAQGHGPQGKTTICHATGSATNPYVEITISDNALPAHTTHQDGRDIVPAPAGGCPGAAPVTPPPSPKPPAPVPGAGAGTPAGGTAAAAPAATPAVTPAVPTPAATPPRQQVKSVPTKTNTVSSTPVVTTPTQQVKGQLPFTGLNVWLLFMLGLMSLLLGAGLRLASRRS